MNLRADPDVQNAVAEEDEKDHGGDCDRSAPDGDAEEASANPRPIAARQSVGIGGRHSTGNHHQKAKDHTEEARWNRVFSDSFGTENLSNDNVVGLQAN